MARLAVMLTCAWCFVRSVSGQGGDPSPTWEAFAKFEAAPGKNVTFLSFQYTVPPCPLIDDGVTPKWWAGLQSTDGMGVLMKSQLTWQNSSWIINTEVLDYSMSPSPKVISKTLPVASGDEIEASVRMHLENPGMYTLAINRVASPSDVSTQTYMAGVAETRAYVVMEHQPKNCATLPQSEHLTFHVAVGDGSGGRANSSAVWTPGLHIPACSTKSVVDGQAVTFSWEVPSKLQTPIYT